MGKQDEYKSLREEILVSLQVVKNYRNMLYVTVVATMAFAFDKGIAILFLVPFCAIFPIYFLAKHQFDLILRMGAYISVFLEPGTDCRWETRLFEYDELYQDKYSTKSISANAYISISSCCLLLSMLHLDLKNINVEFFVTCIIQLILLLVCIYLFLIKKMNNLVLKENYIREWREIQRNEMVKMQKEENKFNIFIIQSYNQAKRGQLLGTIYAGTDAFQFSELKDINKFIKNRKIDKIYLRSRSINTDIEFYKWQLEGYEIKKNENKIFIRLTNGMEVELKC